MTTRANLADELVQLVQLVVLEGTKVVGAFGGRHDLHPTDVEALSRVRIAQDRGAPLTAGALAEALALTTGAVTSVVDRLQRAGHLERVRDPTDRRRVHLHYSADGLRLADEFFTPLLRHAGVVMDQFTVAELEVVRRYLALTVADMTAQRQSLADPAVSRGDELGGNDRA